MAKPSTSITQRVGRERRLGSGVGRWLVAVAAISTGSLTMSTLATEPGVAGAAAGERIVLVAGSKPVAANDTALLARLQANGDGLPVEVVDDGKVATIDPTGARAIVVSSTVSPAAVGTKLRDLAVPVVIAEAKLLDEMAMAATDGETAANTSLDIIAETHPLAAGTSGRVVVLTQAKPLSFGSGLASGAGVVATAPGQPTKAVLFTIARGATTIGGLPAPSCRTAIFTSASAPAKLSASGAAIVDAAVAEAVACSAQPGFALDVAIQPLDGTVVPRFAFRADCRRGATPIGVDTLVVPVGGGRVSVTRTGVQALQAGDVCQVTFSTTGANVLPGGWVASPANPSVTAAVSTGAAAVSVTIDQIDVGPLGFTVVQDLALGDGVTEPALAIVMNCVRGSTAIGGAALPQPPGDLTTMVVTKVNATPLAAGDVCTLRAGGPANSDVPPGFFVDPRTRAITIGQPASRVAARFTYTSGAPHGFTIQQDLPASVPAGTPPFTLAINCRRDGALVGGSTTQLAPGDLAKTVFTKVITRTLLSGDVCDAAVVGLPEGWSVSPAFTTITVTGAATAKTVKFTLSRPAQPRGFTIVQDLADDADDADDVVPPFVVDVQCRRGPFPFAATRFALPPGDLTSVAVTSMSSGALVAGDDCSLTPRGVAGALPTGWSATFTPSTVTVGGAAGTTTRTMSVARVPVVGFVIRQEIAAPVGTSVPAFSVVVQCARGGASLGGRVIAMPAGSPVEVVLDRINASAFQVGDTCNLEAASPTGTLPPGWTATPAQAVVVAAADAATAVATFLFSPV